MISVKVSGASDRTNKFLKKLSSGDIYANLNRFGAEGVNALAQATPVDTRLTADSWRYKVVKTKGKYYIKWYNTNVTETGDNVVILLQYGHATRNGAWIEGIDFVNPAIRPIFEKITTDVWEQVRNG